MAGGQWSVEMEMPPDGCGKQGQSGEDENNFERPLRQLEPEEQDDDGCSRQHVLWRIAGGEVLDDLVEVHRV